MYQSPMKQPLVNSARPEQTFFSDPALDRVFGVVMALASEVSVLNAKLAALEKHLEKHGGGVDWDLQQQDPQFMTALEKSRKEFVDYLMDPLLGVQKSKGAA